MEKIKPKKPYIIFVSFILIIMALAIGFSYLNSYENPENSLENALLDEKPNLQTKMPPEDFCRAIRGTPAWLLNGELYYGYRERLTNVDTLIKNDVYYLYNPDCAFCIKQKELWGDEQWQKLQSAGLTVNCKEVLGR